LKRDFIFILKSVCAELCVFENNFFFQNYSIITLVYLYALRIEERKKKKTGIIVQNKIFTIKKYMYYDFMLIPDNNNIKN
jgi:hypothetical protein